MREEEKGGDKALGRRESDRPLGTIRDTWEWMVKEDLVNNDPVRAPAIVLDPMKEARALNSVM